MRHLAVLATLLLCALSLSAQGTVSDSDSVMLTGVVINNDTRQPYPGCVLRFVQNGQTMAEATADGEGNFFVPALAVGSYELHVKIKSIVVHQADLTLEANADLTIGVDTVMFRMLRAITITDMRHKLGNFLIASRHDHRLWGFTAGYRDANASVALPPDAHGNPDVDEFGRTFTSGMPWQVQQAYLTGTLGTMLLTPPIWELVPDRVYTVDSTKASR